MQILKLYLTLMRWVRLHAFVQYTTYRLCQHLKLEIPLSSVSRLSPVATQWSSSSTGEHQQATTHFEQFELEQEWRSKRYPPQKVSPVLHASSHRFVPRHSCLTSLIIAERINHRHNSPGRPVDVVYLDFSQAFTLVCHRLLIKKMEVMGIHSKINRRLEEFLKKRTFRVK